MAQDSQEGALQRDLRFPSPKAGTPALIESYGLLKGRSVGALSVKGGFSSRNGGGLAVRRVEEGHRGVRTANPWD